MHYDSQLAFKSHKHQEQYQDAAFVALINYLAQNSPYYKRIFAEHNIDTASVTGKAQLNWFPTTSKSDLQQHNWEFLCVKDSAIREYTATSGTMGKPVTIALTENDLRRLAFNEKESFLCAGGKQGDIFQLMLTLDRRFMAGIAYYSGARELGAAVVRSGPGMPEMQWEQIMQLQTTTLVAVPSFIARLIDYALANNIDLKQTPVSSAICIGENIRTSNLELNALGSYINQHWPIRLHSTYASTEMQTAFTECEHGVGGHLQPALLIVEILDDRGTQVKPGEMGEVTITTLGVEGMPLLRYRTGDIATYYDSPCKCGRNSIRLSPVVGRKQQMLKFKGTTLYPPSLFDVLAGIEGVTDYVVEAYSGAMATDELRIHVVAKKADADTTAAIKAAMNSRLRVTPEIVFTDADQLAKLQNVGGGRKLTRFLDNRNDY